MNVFEAAMNRIDYLFKEFDNIYVSFSGGKDSGVLLNLVLMYMRLNKVNRKISVFHMDYEAQYQMTTDYVKETLLNNTDYFDVYWITVPFKVTTCTSMYQNYWRPWNDDEKDLWVRAKPEGSLNQTDFNFYSRDMWDYDFQTKFSSWIHKKKRAKKTACLVGIRTDESLNRWRAIHSDKNYRNYSGLKWTKGLELNIYNAYPIYDFKVSDVWKCNYSFDWSYNKLYDLFYQSGVPVEKMRVASPFLSEAKDSLYLYKSIDPNNWSKMVGRVNGVNMTSIYGGTTAMGWKGIKLPKNHTWESYMYFLLGTLPISTKENYLAKLKTSMEFWREKGGVLSDEVIEKLRNKGIKISVEDSSNYNTSKKPVRMEYLDDFDIKEANLIPTYKRMCICIMKNDHLCKYMGFSQTKNEIQKRKNVINKYQKLL